MADMDWGNGQHDAGTSGTARVMWCDRCGAFVETDRPRCPECGEVIMRCVCTRCFHDWILRRDVPPKVCPACKSPYWARLRRGITLESLNKGYREAGRR